MPSSQKWSLPFQCISAQEKACEIQAYEIPIPLKENHSEICSEPHSGSHDKFISVHKVEHNKTYVFYFYDIYSTCLKMNSFEFL